MCKRETPMVAFLLRCSCMTNVAISLTQWKALRMHCRWAVNCRPELQKLQTQAMHTFEESLAPMLASKRMCTKPDHRPLQRYWRKTKPMQQYLLRISVNDLKHWCVLRCRPDKGLISLSCTHDSRGWGNQTHQACRRSSTHDYHQW